MKFENFDIPSLKELYSRPYDATMIEWRRLGAVDKAQNIISLLGARAAEIETVLEVGAGTGEVLNRLSELGIGRQLRGIEIGDQRLASTLPRPNVELSYYDGSRINAADESFDLVYATHVLEHVLDERRFLHELGRVTRKLVYVEVPLEIHARTSRNALNQTLQIGHINAYNRQSFLLKLETSGLKVIDSRLFDPSFDVHRFASSSVRAAVKMLVRRLALGFGFGELLMSYHFGALCVPVEKLDIA